MGSLTRSLVIAASAMTFQSLGHAAPEALSGCADHSPPFVLTQNGVGISGFSVDLFRQVAGVIGRKAVVKEMPWARCLNEVAKGRVDVAIDAYDDDERRLKYNYSIPYYQLTPQIFYRQSGGPAVMPARTVDELKGLTGCGVREYTYEHYDLDAKTMDLGADNDIQMLKKLAAGRCDYALEELEFIIGGRKYTRDWPDESALTSFKPAWARGPKLHYLIGKLNPQADDLTARINTAIERLNHSGAIRKLRASYFETPAPAATPAQVRN